MATNETLGVDISCVDDIDANLTIVSGALGLGQALARRISTKRYGLFYDGDYGTDVRTQLNTIPNPRVAAQLAEVECLKDERVQDCRAVVEYIAASAALPDQTPDSLYIEVELKTASGPFKFTLDVSDVNSTVLAIE